mmetsp:Transcript_19814/g.37825  ORF Transcript_19814/g.37825 Transcript_19814/m.37825 type:complete len:144 (+) Transcript_19814:153-584(+)
MFKFVSCWGCLTVEKILMKTCQETSTANRFDECAYTLFRTTVFLFWGINGMNYFDRNPQESSFSAVQKFLSRSMNFILPRDLFHGDDWQLNPLPPLHWHLEPPPLHRQRHPPFHQRQPPCPIHQHRFPLSHLKPLSPAQYNFS